MVSRELQNLLISCYKVSQFSKLFSYILQMQVYIIECKILTMQHNSNDSQHKM